MSTIRGIHTADTHLGFRQYGILERELDLQRSFKALVDDAITRKVDYITVSGDMLNDKNPSIRTMKFLAEINTLLIEHGIPMLVTSGNHDGSVRTSNWMSVFCTADDYHTLTGVGGIFDIDYKHVFVGGVTIYGAPYLQVDKWLELQETLEGADVLLMHQTFSEFFGFPVSNAFNANHVDASKFKVVVVGDIHVADQFDIKADSGRFDLISPGSTELISKTEDPSKTYVLSEFDETLGEFEFFRHQLPTRPVISVTITNEEDMAKLVADIKLEAVKPLVFLHFDLGVSGSHTAMPEMFEIYSLAIVRLSFESYVAEFQEQVDFEHGDSVSLETIGSVMFSAIKDSIQPSLVAGLEVVATAGLIDGQDFKGELLNYIERFSSEATV